MHTVCRAALKNDYVCIRKDTWTDGPAHAEPLSVCTIESLHYIPLYQRSHLCAFKKKHDTLKGKVWDDALFHPKNR